MNANTKTNTRYEVRYVGAPYGGNEYQLVSWHRTREAAGRAIRELTTSPKYYGNVRIVEVAR